MSNIAVRWSGVLLILGAALMAVGFSMLPFGPTGPLFDLILLLSSVFLLLSLPGMYSKQASEAGWFGLAGHALLQIGMLIFVVALSPSLRYPSYKPPGAGENAVDFLLALAFSVGLLLTAIATIRAAVFPHWAGILLLIGLGGFIFGFFIAGALPAVAGLIGITLLGIPFGFAWIGVVMLRGKSAGSSPRAPNRLVSTGQS